MKPDRSNYEIWFIDWLDGNLSRNQAEDLEAFLEKNPDLKEEFNGLAAINVEPPAIIFNGKKGLEKSPADYTESQFEQLCIANLENDITSGQKSELEGIIVTNETRRRTFELYQKLKLKPSAIEFSRKNITKKPTAGQKIIMWSFIGLSAAATIAALILVPMLVNSDPNINSNSLVRNSVPDTLFHERRTPVIIEKEISSANDILRAGNAQNVADEDARETDILLADNLSVKKPDSVPVIQRTEALSAVKMEIPATIINAYNPSSDILIAWNPAYIPPLIDDRNNLERFLAKFFHEKIMNDSTSGSRPVESYEIAVAGINGLNRLFGWEMALHKNTDENGDIRSYNFTSRLLKFNAPVKKSSNNL
jgi:hypothetical protein